MHLQGKNPTDQKGIDDLMMGLDGTDNKGKLGANAILAVSMAVCKVGPARGARQHASLLCRRRCFAGGGLSACSGCRSVRQEC